MARRVFPSRLELNIHVGSSSDAPLANVTLTIFLYVSPVQIIPAWDPGGNPRHFHSSTTSGSARCKQFPDLARFSPRQRQFLDALIDQVGRREHTVGVLRTVRGHVAVALCAWGSPVTRVSTTAGQTAPRSERKRLSKGCPVWRPRSWSGIARTSSRRRADTGIGSPVRYPRQPGRDNLPPIPFVPPSSRRFTLPVGDAGPNVSVHRISLRPVPLVLGSPERSGRHTDRELTLRKLFAGLAIAASTILLAAGTAQARRPRRSLCPPTASSLRIPPS